MSDAPLGPGSRREGPAETPGLPRSRGRNALPDPDRPQGPGARVQLSPADQKRQSKQEARRGRPEPFYDFWVRLMNEALSGKNSMASPYPWRPQFNANLAHLRTRVDDGKVRTAMEEFAAAVKAGRVPATGKLWGKFFSTFEKYGTGGGVATKIETSDRDEDWL